MLTETYIIKLNNETYVLCDLKKSIILITITLPAIIMSALASSVSEAFSKNSAERNFSSSFTDEKNKRFHDKLFVSSQIYKLLDTVPCL